MDSAEDTQVGTQGIDFWSLLIIYLVEIIGAILFAIYRMANFTHAGDTDFGRSILAKTILSSGIFMWIFPVIWVPMDVLLSGHSDLAKTINLYVLTGTSSY